jgi:hypothetical protein
MFSPGMVTPRGFAVRGLGFSAPVTTNGNAWLAYVAIEPTFAAMYL